MSETKTKPNPLNLYQKLVEVRKSVTALEKSNKGHQYQYVSSSQVLSALREAMNEQGLLLIPSVTKEHVKEYETRSGAAQVVTKLWMNFEWINADSQLETLVVPWFCMATGNHSQAVGACYTYAEKYFLLKFFNIPTDKDDPDANTQKDVQRAPRKQKAPETKKETAEEQNTKRFLAVVTKYRETLGDDFVNDIVGGEGFGNESECVGSDARNAVVTSLKAEDEKREAEKAASTGLGPSGD